MIALLAGVSGAWADVLNLTPSNGTYVTSSGNYVNSISFSTSPAITVTASANNMDKRQTSTYLLWHSGSSGSSTYTISAGAGYIITAYSVTGEANTSAQTLTAGAVSHEFAVGASSSFEVTGLKSSSVSFVQTGVNASGLKITSISVTVEEDSESPSWIPSFGIGSTIVVTGDKAESVTAATNGEDNDHWYLVTQVRNGESALYDNGTQLMRGTTDKTAASFDGATVESSSAYLVRFISAGSEDLYHIQLGNGRYIVNLDANPDNGTAVNTTSDYWSKGTHAFYNSNGGSGSYFGWNLNSKTAKRVDNNGAGNALSYWGEGTASGTSGNSIWYVYPVTINTPASTVEVTYNLVVGGDIVNTIVTIVAANSEINIPSELTAGYASSYYNFNTSGTIGDEDCTITVTLVLKDETVVYPYTNVSNNKSYYIYTNNKNRGGLSTYTDGETKYLAASVKTGISSSPKKFAIINYEENYYLYSVDDEMFVTFDGAVNTNAALAATVTGTSDRITFNQTNAPLYEVKFDGSSSKIFNSSNSSSYPYGIVFNGWGATSNQWDDGCQYTINEADDFDPTSAIAALDEFFHPSYTVTYVVKDVNGTTIFTSDPVPTSLGANITALPTEYQRGFCSYNSVDVTISEVSTVIEFTATYTGLPFTLSPSYAEATWYNMNIRSTKDVSKGESEPYALAAATIADKAEDAYRWAFAGNPYALVVYNKATADTYTLSKDGNNAVMREGTYTWSLFQNGDGFTLKVTGSDHTFVNDVSSELGFWDNASAATDNGSTFRVEAVVDNYYDYVKAEVLPFIFDNPEDIIGSSTAASLGKPFGITTAASESMVGTYGMQMYTKNFSLSEYEAIKAEKDAAIIYPEAGKIYLVKNNYNGKYMRVTASGTRGTVLADLTAEEAAKDASAHFTFVENASHLYMSTQGEYLNWVWGAGDGYEGYTSTNFDKYVHFAVPAPGVGAFSIAYGNGEGGYAGYLGNGFYALKDTETKVVAGSPTDQTHEMAQWTFEEVKTLTVDLHDGGDGYNYATLCVPFAFSDIMGAVYTLAANANGHTLDVTPVANVPAGTPVLLKSTASSIDFTLGSDYASTPVAGSALTGTYFAKTIVGDTDYVLGTDGTKVGFYHWDTNNLGANRAYVAGEAGVKGFAINWDDADAIKSLVDVKPENRVIYNLAGQRVDKLQRGVNIVNGKKVIVK